jgi:hypothetical protein
MATVNRINFADLWLKRLAYAAINYTIQEAQVKTKVKVEVIVEVTHPATWPVAEILSTAKESVYCGGIVGSGTTGSYSAEKIGAIHCEVVK